MLLRFSRLPCLALALAGLAAGPRFACADVLFPQTSPRFAADVTPHLNQDGSSSIHVEIQVPYSELEFVRVSAGYGAALEFVAVVRDGHREVGGDVWEERFVVKNFDSTRNATIRIATERTFAVKEGRYRVKVRVHDLNGGRQSEAEAMFEVEGLGGSTLGLTDLVFGACGLDTTSGTEGFLRNASRRYAEELENLCIESAVLDLSGPVTDRRYGLHWRVRDESSNELVSGDTVLVGDQARRFHLRPPVAQLFLGSYEVQIDVQEGKRHWTQSGNFEVEAVTVPVGAAWVTLLEVLEYVATPTELDPLRKASTPEERAHAWKTFWAHRDPTPGTERNETLIEFMRRIKYANAQFQGLGPGWRTDQGHIYIKYGAPDQVEDIPASMTSYPSQIWHYYELNRKYTFIDRDGFGRYVLVSETGP